MRSAGRVTWVSRALMVLGFLSLLVPAVASASGKGGGGRQVKTRTKTRAKDSKKKMALQRSKMGREKKGGNSTKAAGHLPRPAAGKSTTSKASEGNQRGMLASALTGSRARPAAKPSARRTAKTRRPVRKTRVTKKTRRPTAKKRRAARTQRNRPRRSSQGLEESAAAPEAPDPNAPVVTPLDVGAEQPVEQRGRFRRFLGRVGRSIRENAKYALVIAAPAAVLAAGFTIVGGATVMGIGFAIAAPAIFLGVPILLRTVRPQDVDQNELLQRYMGREMLENHDLDGVGPGNNVSGAGGLNSLNNMIDPGGMR